MLSMLAKYIPGGVWTPTARVVALRRFGVKDTPVVLASILLEAGHLGGRRRHRLRRRARDHRRRRRAAAATRRLWRRRRVPALPTVFGAVASRLLRPFGADEVAPLPSRTAFELLGFYALTWPLGGAGLFFMLRSVGGDPAVSSIPYLGGVAAVGAIVAVLAVFAPSGLGVREASMYGLMLAVTTESVALGATVLNRLAITLVEAVLVLVGFVLLRGSRKPTVVGREVEAAPVAALPRDEVLRG